MEVTEVGAPGGKKVSQSLLGKAKQVLILLHSLYLLCICALTT